MSLRHLRIVGSSSAWAAIIMVVLQPCHLQASIPVGGLAAAKEARDVADIALRRGGTLQGQVVNDAGAGVVDVVVELTDGRQRWQAKTDNNGWFQMADLRGGTYQFLTAGQQQTLRLWSDGTAPPKASLGILVTPSTDVFRGQRVLSPNVNQFFRVAKKRLANPLVVTGVALTAVAIPVAIHNSDDDPPATP